MYRRAMEELDLYVFGPNILPSFKCNNSLIRYLPSYPYQDNPVFHTYAGLIALHLAQPAGGISSETTYGTFNLLRRAALSNSSFFLAVLLTSRSEPS